jgi:hypothetical protein
LTIVFIKLSVPGWDRIKTVNGDRHFISQPQQHRPWSYLKTKIEIIFTSLYSVQSNTPVAKGGARSASPAPLAPLSSLSRMQKESLRGSTSPTL